MTHNILYYIDVILGPTIVFGMFGWIIIEVVRDYIKAKHKRKEEEKRVAMIIATNINQTEDIVIGANYEHIKGRYKSVIITNKTKSSIEFKDAKGFISWIDYNEFSKFFKLKTK